MTAAGQDSPSLPPAGAQLCGRALFGSGAPDGCHRDRPAHAAAVSFKHHVRTPFMRAERLLLERLGSLGRQLSRFDAGDIHVYLYDLSAGRRAAESQRISRYLPTL